LSHSGAIVERDHETGIEQVGVQWGRVAPDVTFFWVECCPKVEAVSNFGVYLEVLRSPFLGVDVGSEVMEVRTESAFGQLGSVRYHALEVSTTTASALAAVFIPLGCLGRVYVIIIRDLHEGMIFSAASTSIAASSSTG
jgi:hypothetical protein